MTRPSGSCCNGDDKPPAIVPPTPQLDVGGGGALNRTCGSNKLTASAPTSTPPSRIAPRVFKQLSTDCVATAVSVHLTLTINSYVMSITLVKKKL